jgi:hypothetical protein
VLSTVGSAALDVGAALREALAPLWDRLRALEDERDRLLARLTTAERDRDRWQRRAKQLAAQNERLKTELEEARRAAKRQAAPFGRHRRKKNPKAPGRKAGHPAAHRPVPNKVDEHIHVPLVACPRCGGSVEDVRPLAPQYVDDITPPPDPRHRVLCYHNQSGYCPRCNRRVESRHPDQCSGARGAAGVQIGPHLIALATELHYRVGVTFGKITGVVALIFGITVCAATWARAARRVAKRLQPTHLSLVAAVRESAVANVDETGWYITWAGIKKPWLHVFAAAEWGITLFAIRLSRGRDVALEVLGEHYQGAIGIDGWAAYIQLPYLKGQCNGHFLRRCAELLEVQKQGAARFPHALRRLLLDGIQAKALLPSLPPDAQAGVVEQFQGQMRHLLEGRIEEPANRRFAEHLRRHEDEIFTFLTVPGLGPTNNEAEREIRPGVILRKISAGNRTTDGAHDHEVIASVSRTAQRNGLLLPRLLPSLLCSTNPEEILPVLAHRAMPAPVAPLPGWKEDKAHGTHRTRRRVRRAGRRLGLADRAQAREAPS